MVHRSVLFGALALLLAISPLWHNKALAAPDYEFQVVKTGLMRPWSINFGSDGRLWFTSRNSANVQLSALDLASGAVQVFTSSPPSPVRIESESGVLGMVFDPDFASNNWVYICYSYSNGATDLNRLSRYTVDFASETIGQETILIDAMAGAAIHNGCRVVFSPDNQYLFVTVGDANNTALAQDIASPAGKTFRIFKDGGIPTDNPFYAAGQLVRSRVWTLGHRNHQGLAFEPATGLLWSTEHGPNTRDELNILEAGRNYGWPTCLGVQPTCPSVTNYAPAIAEFDTSNTVATSDMTFYTGTAFPEWQGNLFFVTLKTGRLYRLAVSNRSIIEREIVIDNQYGRLRDVTVGPDGFIYIVNDSSSARLVRVRTPVDKPFRSYLTFVSK